MKKAKIEGDPSFFFIYFLADPRSTLSHHRGNRATDPILIAAFTQVLTKGHWRPNNKVEFLSPAEYHLQLS